MAANNITRTVGFRIRHLRLERGWNLEVVAQQLDISIPALSKIETGLTDVNFSRLEQIAKIFNMDVLYLFIEAGQLSAGIPPASLSKLADLEHDIVLLQRKIIELYEALKA